jgi:hypothetical protein
LSQEVVDAVPQGALAQQLARRLREKTARKQRFAARHDHDERRASELAQQEAAREAARARRQRERAEKSAA